MNAEPILTLIARALTKAKLEVVMIGNAAAALQGAPVTTLDFDFCFRAAEVNERKIRAFARALDATISRPHEPVSTMVRVENDDISMQVDFLPDKPMGMNLASLRSRAARISIAGHGVWVADLEDIAAGKRKANRPKDKAALYVIETVIEEKKRR
jgi:predicted nucleotidyltransferase